MKKVSGIVLFMAVGLLCLTGVDLSAQQETPPGANQDTFPSKPQPEQLSQEDQNITSLSQELSDWKARWELARVLSYVQRYEESIAEYKKVLQEKPDLKQAKLEMAKVLAWAGHREQAQNILETFARKDLDPQTRIELADIYAAQKEYAKAISIYQTHLGQHPKQDKIRLKLAQTLSWAGEYEKSLKEYKTLVDKHPEDIQLRRQYAQVLTWAERYEQAIEQYRRSFPDK